MENKVIEVVAAVIEKNGSILATQRGYGDFKDKWEFPGGKIEAGESREEALIREIKEELHASIKVCDYLVTTEYDYPKFHLIMHAYLCTLVDNYEFVYHSDSELEHENMVWLDTDNLDYLDWLPADIAIVDAYKKLKRVKG